MNGQSFTPRLRENMNENMEFPGATGEYIEWLQDSFAKTIKEVVERDKNDPFVKREERGKVIHSFQEKWVLQFLKIRLNKTFRLKLDFLSPPLSCSASKETFDLTVTRGTLWSNKV